MKKLAFVTCLLTLGFAASVHADTNIINYSGTLVTKQLELSNGDLININANVPKGTKVKIRITPAGVINSALFTFNSTLEGVYPKRMGDFTDTMYTTTSPAQVTYTYTGKRDKMNAVVEIFPGT